MSWEVRLVIKTSPRDVTCATNCRSFFLISFFLAGLQGQTSIHAHWSVLGQPLAGDPVIRPLSREAWCARV
jgi:hypothetical protein